MKNPAKSIIWVIDGSLKDQLHQNARIYPAVELARMGWQVIMITSAAPDKIKTNPIDFVEVTSPRIYFLGILIYYLKILRILFSNKISGNILFFQLDSMAPILLTVPILQSLLRKKQYQVVMDYRSMPMDTLSVRGKLRSLVYLVGHLMALISNIHMTAITRRMANILKLPGKKLIGIWPSGANVDDFRTAFEKRRWPGENEPVRMLYIGAMQAERNLTAVIEAAKTAIDKGINLTLDIIGGGDQKESLQKHLQNQKSDSIKVWGPVPQNQIPKLLSNYHIGILPFPNIPRMNVSSAIKMFEYMAAGMPILATKIEAHTGIFKDKDFVFWTDETAESMTHAMLSLSVSKAQLPVLGKHARDYSYAWSWEESAKKLSKALESII